jgi:hypothetical protein
LSSPPKRSRADNLSVLLACLRPWLEGLVSS